MPSLAAGTNWTFTGRLVSYPGADPQCITASVPVTFKVVVASAGDLSTNYSYYDATTGSLVQNCKQQTVVLTVTWTVAGVSTVKNFYGLFLKGHAAEGAGLFYSTNSAESIELQVVTADGVCSGKQAAAINYVLAGGAYSTEMGFVCRNNTVL